MNSFFFSVSPCLRGEGFDFIASDYSLSLRFKGVAFGCSYVAL